MANRTKKPTWILICDASRAHLYREEPNGKGFTSLESFEHGESRARTRELMADANGRKPNGNPGGNSGGNYQGIGGVYMGRPGAAPDTDAKSVEHLKFARELADRLEKGLNEHEYEGLVLIAPPHFLGLLKREVSTQVSKHIEETIDKDLSWLDAPRLEERLRELRAAA